MMHKSKGFTLIELLVVISIIALLSSVVLSSLNTARQRSRDAKRMSDLRQIQTALELYYDANGRYPVPAAGDNNWSGHCPGYGNYDTYITGISSFMARLPIDPAFDTGGQCYLYRTANSGADYKLLAHGTTEAVCPVSSTHPFYDAARAGQCTFQVSSQGGSGL